MDKLFVSNNVIIEAPATKVWNALTNPSETKKYMFGCETVSDWKDGSSLSWKMIHDGKEIVAVKGNVVAIDKPVFLEYTTFDPNSSIPDIAENYLHVTYELIEKEGKTILTVTQGDYSKVADGKKRYDDTINGGGWMSILTQIKDLVEKY